jgi:catechol 2,3-dioxygenase-like lactoylglutathione lyase family enzyme
MGIIDHLNLPVRDLARARRFYEAVLAPLGYPLIAQEGRAFGFGRSNWSFGVNYAAFVLDPDGHNIEAVFRGTASPVW